MKRWPQEDSARLEELWAVGLTASQAALKLSRELGEPITRNMVIGKVHRLELPPREKLPYAKGRYTRTPEQNAHRREVHAAKRLMNGHSPSLAPINGKARHMKPRLWKARHASPVAYAGEPITVLQFTSRRCKYAVTETKPFLFCGAPSDGPWCPHHHSIVYRPI